MSTPQIRFEGFNDEWNTELLGKSVIVKSAARVHKDEWQTSGVPFFRTSDVTAAVNGGENTKAFISFDLYEELAAKSGKLQKGDLLVVGGGSIGTPYLVPNNEPLYSKDADLLWIQPRGLINSEYLAWFFISPGFSKHLRSISHAGTISHYTIEQAKNTPIPLPSPTEQEAIGNYFRELGELLECETQKLTHLRNLKSTMLVKMFPQAGSTVPEIRFAGFDDEWKLERINSVASGDQGGGTPSTVQREFWEGDIPWIQSSDVKVGETAAVNCSKYITPEAIKNSATSLVPANSLAIVTRVGVGKIAAMTFPYATSQDFISLTGLLGDIGFLSIAIQQAILRDINQLQGSTIKGMTRDDVLRKHIYVPSPAEQEAIGNYFRNLDELIRLEEDKLTKLNNLKSSLLTTMFA